MGWQPTSRVEAMTGCSKHYRSSRTTRPTALDAAEHRFDWTISQMHFTTLRVSANSRGGRLRSIARNETDVCVRYIVTLCLKDTLRTTRSVLTHPSAPDSRLQGVRQYLSHGGVCDSVCRPSGYHLTSAYQRATWLPYYSIHRPII
jgi:hypothetical protein